MRLPSPILRLTALAAVVTALGACDLAPPQERVCPTFPPGSAPVKSSQGPLLDMPPAEVVLRAVSAPAREVSAIGPDIEQSMRAAIADTPARTAPTFRVLSLSSGGEYGAFGAGFLRGWSENPGGGRPVFDLVTGISAGATLAPVAFAGPAFDPLLDRYDGLDQSDVFFRRSLLSILRAPSVTNPAPLVNYLRRALDARMIEAIAAGDADGRRLMIGATDLDTGRGEIFDLGDAARAPNAAPCIVQALLASSAIPGVFPPRDINGDLYADGGLRTHVFLQAIDEARTRIERELGREIRVEAYIVINGALTPPSQRVRNRLPSYLLRSVDILADEVLRDSIGEAVAFAELRPNWNLRGIRARIPARTCDGEDASGEIGGFDSCVTSQLFEHGRDAGRRTPIDWLDAAELSRLAAEL